MYVRIATFTGGDPSRADEIIESVRSMIQTRAQDIPGAKRFMLLVDREGGRGLGVTFFESEDALRSAEPIFEQMTSAVPDAGGTRQSVDVYEVAVEEEIRS